MRVSARQMSIEHVPGESGRTRSLNAECSLRSPLTGCKKGRMGAILRAALALEQSEGKDLLLIRSGKSRFLVRDGKPAQRRRADPELREAAAPRH